MYLAKPERQTTRGDHRTLAKVTHVITEEGVPEDPYIYMEARIQKSASLHELRKSAGGVVRAVLDDAQSRSTENSDNINANTAGEYHKNAFGGVQNGCVW